MEEDNIIWKDMSKKQTDVPQNTEENKVEACQLPEYYSLYAELLDKISPQNYMPPHYDKEKLVIANELYNRLLKTNWKEDSDLYSLRKESMQKLGITFSTKQLYCQLLAYCDPNMFMDDYDYEKVNISNYYYALVEENKNNIEKLEQLKEEIYNNQLIKDVHKKKEEQVRRQKEREKQRKLDEADGLELPWHFIVLVIFFIIVLIVLENFK